jgi:hypothetical protein
MTVGLSPALPPQARKLLTAAFMLAGLRVKRDVARQVFRGVRAMRDSDTYLAIIEEGKEIQAKRNILLAGEERLGPADDSVKARLNAVADLSRLARMIRRAAKATAWDEVLATP